MLTRIELSYSISGSYRLTESCHGMYYRAVRFTHFREHCVRICKTALCHLGTTESIELADWRRLTIWTAASLDPCLRGRMLLGDD